MTIKICYDGTRTREERIFYRVGDIEYQGKRDAIKANGKGDIELFWLGIVPINFFMEMKARESELLEIIKNCKRQSFNCERCTMLCEQEVI